ncbi:Uncharacterised protein [Mycobacteroides abscessus subsp. massiliense]|nr:hypothetical protein [Mycobacteroides abscessus]SLH52076.1 Uncharacterised protein [Mycobacteroides abscessus subsp. massiliense]
MTEDTDPHHHFQRWSPIHAELFGPTHTWVSSWRLDLNALHEDVTAAGWQWNSVECADRGAAVLAAVFEMFVSRGRRQSRPRAERPVMLAVGPEVPWNLPELSSIAVLGRACAVHLAVAADRLPDIGCRPDPPIEFYDNILGWYQATSLAS